MSRHPFFEDFCSNAFVKSIRSYPGGQPRSRAATQVATDLPLRLTETSVPGGKGSAQAVLTSTSTHKSGTSPLGAHGSICRYLEIAARDQFSRRSIWCAASDRQ